MSINLLKMLQDQMGDSVLDQAGKFLGENSAMTKAGVGALLPTIMGGLMNKGNSESGASGILDMITKGNHDGSILDNLGGLFGGGSSTSNFMNAGSLITSALFGGSKLGSILEVVTRMTGMRRSSSSSLMNLLAPMIMGMVGRYVKKNGLNAKGLMDMLMGQKDHVAAAMPSELSGALGWADMGSKVTGAVKTATSKVTETATSAREVVEETSRSGGSMLRWAVPLVALIGIGFWLFNRGGNTDQVSQVATDTKEMVEGATTTMNETATKTVNATGDAMDKTADAVSNTTDAVSSTTSAATQSSSEAMSMDAIIKAATAKGWSHTVDASGNLIEVKSRKVVAKKGEWKVNAKGVVMDASGKEMSGVAKFGSMLKGMMDKTGEAIGDAAKATGAALSGAAAKAKERFSGVFKADAATKAKPVTFSKIDWNGAKIKNYNKDEFMGLAESLKENPDAKITIQSFGDNKAISTQRANWVKTMLQNLGVAAGQIKAKGMVDKAKGDATQMVVK